MNCYHLLSAGSCWALTRESDSTILREYKTRWQAIDESRVILDAETCSLIIHGKDGKVEAVRYYPLAAPSCPAAKESFSARDLTVRNALRPPLPVPVSRRRSAHKRAVSRSMCGETGAPSRSISRAARTLEATRIGSLILSTRVERGLTQKALASLLGVSKWSVKEWEKGRSCPDKFRKEVEAWVAQKPVPTLEALTSPVRESLPDAVSETMESQPENFPTPEVTACKASSQESCSNA